MSIDRTVLRTGLAIAAGATLGLLAPMLPAVGATSPPATCTLAVGAASRVTAIQSGLVGRISLPVAVQTQLTAAQSRLVGAASQVCALP